MIFVHIGMPKTGSSAIQAFLSLNYEKLLKNGVYFPNPPELKHPFQTSVGNARDLAELFETNDVEGIRKMLDRLDSNVTVLSSEYLYGTVEKYPDRFFNVFNNYDFKIICYVRRQHNLFSSLYNQYVKNHYGVKKHYDAIDLIAKKFDFSNTLLECLKFVEPTKIIVRPYEKQQLVGGNIYSDFLHCIGLQLDDEYRFPEKIVNPSLRWDALEFRRLLNVMVTDHNDETSKHFINELLVHYTVEKNFGEPFQDWDILSPEERIEIINAHKKKNEQIAKIFLNREDGQLFYDPIPECDGTWQEKKFSFENAVDICKYLLKSKYENNLDEELIKSIIKGAIDRILIDDDHYFDNLPLIYRLISKPVIMSRHISTFERKFDCWYIEACGADPHFILPNYNAGQKGIYVKIQITASMDTMFELFYLSDNKMFDAKHCFRKNIKKGYNEIMFQIKDEESIHSIRIDPGNAEGIYLLHNVEIRGI